MTDQAENTGAPAGSERVITFRDREIWVKFPEAEQLVVFKRTVAMLERDVDGWNGAQVLNAADRVRRIVDSVILNEVDRDWIDDEILDKRLKLESITEILLLTVKAFGDPGQNEPANRAEKRAVAKKATRRKVTP